MREDVCILLNEREPMKRQLATELQEQCALRRLSAERLAPADNLAKIILQRQPRVLVLDYVLAEVTTALDLLNELRDSARSELPEVILWTDEPSVSVAVEAMKLGAHDYVELRATSSLEKVLRAIESAMQLHGGEQQGRGKITRRAYEAPVSESRSFTRCLELASGAARTAKDIIVLSGPSGVGRNTVAQYIHNARHRPGSYIDIDLDTWPNDLRTLTGDDRDPTHSALLSYGATVMLDHVEYDPGEVLEAIHSAKGKIWRELREERPLLVVGTNDTEVARAWHRITDAQIIDIPSLAEREEDFWPLIQYFVTIARPLLGIARLKLSSSLLKELSKLDWPGNVRELRGVIVEALSSTTMEKGTDSQGSATPKNEQKFLETVTYVKSRYEEFLSERPIAPDPLRARIAIDKSLGNYRIAAARIGTGVPQLRAALMETSSAHSREIKQ